MNVKNCEVIFFGFVDLEKLKMQGEGLEWKTFSKNLGEHFNKWLRFNQHIDYVVKKEIVLSVV